jgi:hypothetical protein
MAQKAEKTVAENESAIEQNATPANEPEQKPIPKPGGGFSLDKFKVKRAPTIAVNPLLERLAVLKIGDVGDFARLHPDEEAYWSVPLCFVDVPVKGTKKTNLHLIDEDVALQYVSGKKIQRFRLALASKPWDVFFFCKVPCINLDNSFNKTALDACEQAKTTWVEALSRKDQGHDDYQIVPAQSQKAFPLPKWPSQSLEELIGTSFKGQIIESSDHPGLLRLLGADQELG